MSLEDARRPNELSLLEAFKGTVVVLGVLGIARSRIETVNEIESRLRAALEHLDKDRLMAAPDCGLGILPQDILAQKLANMVAAVNQIG